ncbi:MAG TPA: threonine synthase [Acidobacteriota bacterium]|jgi:threonine synthase
MSQVTHLECSRCLKEYPPRTVINLCECGGPLLVRYNLRKVKRSVTKTELEGRPWNMWRYFEAMPLDSPAEMVSLSEGGTPIIPLRKLGAELGLRRLFLKDEADNPTGSFKARGLSAAVSMAKALGLTQLAMPSAGNAGGALAAYAARAGLQSFLFMPRETPQANIVEARVYGAQVELVDGSISDAGARMNRVRQPGWFDMSTLKEPYRIEGKKTMGYEIAEQFQWALPDVILYPAGGGTGLIGMWKAFEEMQELSWTQARPPRMVAVQAAGCAPVVKAFQEGKNSVEPWPNPKTIASGLRVPAPIGDALMLGVLRKSEGTAVAVDDESIRREIFEAGKMEGIFFSPEGASTIAALRKLKADNWLSADQSIVIFNTGSGLKYLEVTSGEWRV